MKNKSTKKKPAAAKTIFRKAGEAIGAIGHEIVEGKEKLVEASEVVAEKFSDVKAAISKKIAGTPVKKVAKKKAAVAKKTAKKLVKKAVKKIAKKAKKAAPKKSAVRKAARKK